MVKDVRLVGAYPIDEYVKEIRNEMKVTNDIQILDRLYEHGAISTEEYITKLQRLYSYRRCV